jgi:cobalamin biosynthesis Mg chelatase CobN
MSIFNPYVLLGIVLAVLSAFGGGYWKGSEDEITRQQLEIAKLNAEARQKEQALTMAVTQTATALRTSNEKARQISKERDLAISSGALRLRLPVKATNCPVQAPTDDTTPARDSGEARAELDAETARTLIAITDSGDEAIRQLTACQQAYQSVYETLKEKP